VRTAQSQAAANDVTLPAPAPARDDDSIPIAIPSGAMLSPQAVLAAQRAAGNGAVTRLLRPVQRDKAPSVEDRVAVLEKKTDAGQLDQKWRAQFGARLSGYRDSIYRLTAGFQAGITNFNAAHAAQAQQEAIKDQVFAMMINVAAAGAAEPFLRSALGSLGPKLDSVVEFIENPLLAGQQGVVQAGTTAAQGARSSPPATPAMGGSGDPLSFLASNLSDVESRNTKIENGFVARATATEKFSPDQWKSWDKAKVEAAYAALLADLDRIALPDPEKLEGPNTLATKIELYFWAAWIETHVPGVKGLQIGSKLATRMKAIGLESLADVRFDTTSWIFMEHKPPPPEFDNRMHTWARGWSQKLTK
jgi:hypothetical protein